MSDCDLEKISNLPTVEDIVEAEIACFKADHVSKSELREWCEAYLKAIGHKQCNAYTIREATVIYDILEKFCAGEK